MPSSLAEMMARTAHPGRIEAIYARPARRETPLCLQECVVTADGIKGDHAPSGKRAVTLIQAEHLPVIAALCGKDAVTGDLLRRNIVVSGLNLLAFRKHRLKLGDVILEISGPCPPCSRMEEVLGFGGYTAMRGHGGVYASVIQGGAIAIADAIHPVSDA